MKTQRGDERELGAKFRAGREEGEQGSPRRQPPDSPLPQPAPSPSCPPTSSASPFLPCVQTERRSRKPCDFSVPLFSPLACPVCLSLSHSLQNLHQLKQIQTLKHVNEQLQAENRALTRVVARLSEAVEGSDPQGP